MARSEDEVVEPVGAALERVLVVVGDLDDRVSGSNLADCLVLPEQTGAAEDVVDLLGAPVGVRGRREPAGLDPNPVDTDPLRAGGVAQPLPGRAHGRLVPVDAFDLVPVRKHQCGREDSNLQGALAPTGPKPVAYASSATPAFREG